MAKQEVKSGIGKIKALKVYQGLQWEGTVSSFIAKSSQEQEARGRFVHLDHVPNIGVRVSSNKDSIIVPFANIVCMIMDDSSMEPAVNTQG